MDPSAWVAVESLGTALATLIAGGGLVALVLQRRADTNERLSNVVAWIKVEPPASQRTSGGYVHLYVQNNTRSALHGAHAVVVLADGWEEKLRASRSGTQHFVALVAPGETMRYSLPADRFKNWDGKTTLDGCVHLTFRDVRGALWVRHGDGSVERAPVHEFRAPKHALSEDDPSHIWTVTLPWWHYKRWVYRARRRRNDRPGPGSRKKPNELKS